MSSRASLMCSVSFLVMTKKAFQLYSSRCCRSTNTCAEFKAIFCSRLRSLPPRPLDKALGARLPPFPPFWLSLINHTAQTPGQGLALQVFLPPPLFPLFQTHRADPWTSPAVPGYETIGDPMVYYLIIPPRPLDKAFCARLL
jgi:hypothetical protein